MKHVSVVVTAEHDGYALWVTCGERVELQESGIHSLGTAQEQARQLTLDIKAMLPQASDAKVVRV